MNTTPIDPSQEKPSSKCKKVYSYEQLTDLMSQIELKKREDPRAAVTLLKDLELSHVSLGTLQLAKAEKFFRELASLPLSVFTTQKSDFERMKKMARDLGKKWADQRRQEILYEEIMHG